MRVTLLAVQVSYLTMQKRFLAKYVYILWKLLHIWSVGALLRRNMGQVITYLVGRGASWAEYRSSYYIYGRWGASLGNTGQVIIYLFCRMPYLVLVFFGKVTRGK